MKRMSILLVIACLAAGGCADPLEERSTQEVQGQSQRGESVSVRFIRKLFASTRLLLKSPQQNLRGSSFPAGPRAFTTKALHKWTQRFFRLAFPYWEFVTD